MDVFAILHKNIETLMCVVVKLADERATAVVLAEVAIQLVQQQQQHLRIFSKSTSVKQTSFAALLTTFFLHGKQAEEGGEEAIRTNMGTT